MKRIYEKRRGRENIRVYARIEYQSREAKRRE